MTIRLRSNLTAREIRGEFVVIDTKSGNYHIFNEVGKLIWRGIEADKESEVIVDELVALYKVTLDQARQDFEAFVANLRSYGLLE
jgi:hypothetical protein